jgi:hypothetical protein
MNSVTPLKVAALEDGDQHFYVDAVLDMKVTGSGATMLREWKVRFLSSNPGSTAQSLISFEPLESFTSSSGITEQLVEYEEDRTGLTNTLDDEWEYPARIPGEFSNEVRCSSLHYGF